MAKLNSEKMGGFQGTDVTTGGQQVPSSHSLSLSISSYNCIWNYNYLKILKILFLKISK